MLKFKATYFFLLYFKKGNQSLGKFYVSVSLLTIFIFSSSVFNTVMAQQESTENDTTDQNIEIPFYSADFKSFFPTLTSAQVKAFGDFSVEEALIRMPGIQASREGDINIRGVGYNAYSVSIDGLRMANTGMGSREVDLGALSTDSFNDIVVYKVLDPSMDADALGGAVYLNTHTPVSEGRSLSAIFGGGANTEYIYRAGPSGRGWINYSEKFSDEISVAANLSYQQEQFTYEELKLGYGAVDFGNGPVDVIERVSPSLQNDERGRFSTNVSVNYTPIENSEYFIRGFFNSEARERIAHEDSWVTNGDWIDQTTTGAQGGEGTFSHEASHQNIDISQFAFQAGGNNEFENLKLNYKAGWSQSKTINRDFLFPFQIDGLNYLVDMEDRNHPKMEITNRSLQVYEDGTVDRQFMMGQSISRIAEEHLNDEYSARVDVEYPLEIGTLKAGTSVRFSVKEGEYDKDQFLYYRPNDLRMINFFMLKEPIRNVDVINDSYRIPWFLNTDYTRGFFENQRPLFSSDENYHAYNSEINNFKTNEQVYATYAMGEFEFGNLKVVGGARIEQTVSDFEANQVIFNNAGDFVETADIEESNSDFQLFPNAQLIFKPFSQNRIHLAYSRTMDRPDYYLQNPFERIDNQDSVIFKGNQQLEPVFANNIDLIVEQKLGSEGIVSIGGFYKELSNFIVLRENTLSSGQYDQYQELVYENSDQTASIFGAEFALQQSLTFLPGLLSNFGVYANYTWSESNYETQRGDETAIPGQSPHVINTALSYTQGRFFGQVKYYWSAELLQTLQKEKELAPSVGSSPVYLDRYEDGYHDLSATINYKLTDRFRFWANVKNLLKTETVRHVYEEQLYPTSTYVEEGIDFRLGIRFDL